MSDGPTRPELGRISTAEARVIQDLIEAALEGGLSATDSVNIGLGVYKELYLLARNEDSGIILARASLNVIRAYARAILRSGSTFSSFEIASRAVSCWRQTSQALVAFFDDWDRLSITRKMQIRQARAPKRREPIPLTETTHLEIPPLNRKSNTAPEPIPKHLDFDVDIPTIDEFTGDDIDLLAQFSEMQRP